jgi:uncharacterized protein YggE
MLKLILAMALTLISVFSTQAQSKTDLPLVTVTGEAEINVAPDQMTFTFEIETLNKDINVARANNEARAKSAIQAMHAFQISPDDIQTSSMSIESQYTSGGNGKPRIFGGYQVSRTIVVKMKDLVHAEDLVAELIKAGVNGIEGTQFQRSDYPKFREEARSQAIIAAKRKAEKMARDLGQSIGKAFSITEIQVRSGAPSGLFSSSSNSSSFSGETENQSESVSAMSPGQIKIVARVEVKFELN